MGSAAPTPAADGARLAYPPGATRASLLRSGAGLALTLGPLAIAGPSAPASLILGALALIFAVHAAQTLARARSEVVVSENGIRVDGPIPAGVPWDALVRVTLSYYTTRRDRDGGWMVLTIKGTEQAVRIESTLEGFAGLLARIVGEARARDVALPAATRGNLRPFGINTDSRDTDSRDTDSRDTDSRDTDSRDTDSRDTDSRDTDSRPGRGRD